MHGREGNHWKMMAASVDLDGNVLKPMKVARTAFMEDFVAGRHGCSKRGVGGADLRSTPVMPPRKPS